MTTLGRGVRFGIVLCFVVVVCNGAIAIRAETLPSWPAQAAVVVEDRNGIWLIDASGKHWIASATQMPGGMVVGFPHQEGLLVRDSTVTYSQGDELRLARWDGSSARVLVDPMAMPMADVPQRFRRARGIAIMSVGRGPDVWFTTTALADEEDEIGFLESETLLDLWRVSTTGGVPVRVLAPGEGGEPVVAPDGAHVAVLRPAPRKYAPYPRERRWWQPSRWFRWGFVHYGWRCSGSGTIRLVEAATGEWSDVLDVPCIDEGHDAGWSRPPLVSWSADSRRLRVVVAGTDGQALDAGPVQIVDIDPLTKRVATTRRIDCPVQGTHLSPSGEWFLCRGTAPGAPSRLGQVGSFVTRKLPGQRLHGWSPDETRLILGGPTVNERVAVIDRTGRQLSEGTWAELNNCLWLTSDRLICRGGQVGQQWLDLRDLEGGERRVDGLLDVDWVTLVDASIKTR